MFKKTRKMAGAATVGAMLFALLPILLSTSAHAQITTQPWSLTITPSQTTFSSVGETIDFTYTVTNLGFGGVAGSGPVIWSNLLTLITVTDDKVAVVSCPSTTLVRFASMVCTGSYVTTAQDVANGGVFNTATASGTWCYEGPQICEPIEVQDSATITSDAPPPVEPPTLVKRTKTIIRNFVTRRGHFLTANAGRPRLVERLQGDGGSAPDSRPTPMKLGAADVGAPQHIALATNLSQIRAAAGRKGMAQAAKLGLGGSDGQPQPYRHARPGFDLWAEGVYAHHDDGALTQASSGKFGLLKFGADYLLRPWLLVGALVQFDYMDESSGVLGYRIDGRGWMAGPYVELRITQNVILDLKGLGGRSHNEISPILTFADSFSTTRWLASARLTGSYRYGNWHFSPRAQLVGFWENQHAYTDSLGFLVSGQQVSFGRAILGPELSYKHLTRDGILVEPRIAVKGLWTFAQSKAATVGSIAAAPLSRFIGRLELGLKLQSEKGTRLEFAAASDGLLGNNDLRATTGTVQLTIPFN